MRRSRLHAVLALLAASALMAPLAPAATAAVIPSDPVTYCSGPTPATPCIVDVTVDGASITTPGSEWGFISRTFEIDGAAYVSFTLERAGSFDLGTGALGKAVSVDIKTGSGFVPRLVTGKGRAVTVTRTGLGGVNEVTVTGRPVTVSGQCDQSVWPWTCDTAATEEWAGYFDAQITNNESWNPADQRAAFNGMNYFTNVAATDVPPQVLRDSADNYYLRINLASPHFRADGTTVIKGHGELRIPNRFLREVYGVPDPSTMTGVSLDTSLSGTGSGTVTVSQEAGDDAMLVTYDNVTFSGRVLRVKRGVITPTRPTSVDASRTRATRGRVSFAASRPRGARITGYLARCVPPVGSTVRASAAASPVVVTGLTPGRRYTCNVKATSKAGPSAWSMGVRMPARP